MWYRFPALLFVISAVHTIALAPSAMASLWLSQTGSTRAKSVRRPGPSSVERIAGFILAIHVSLYGFLTIATLFALVSRVLGRV